MGYSAIRISDGYVIAGDTKSYGNETGDILLIKTDSSGNKLWSKAYGGISVSTGYAVIQDGSDFIITGIDGFRPFLMKVYANGNMAWYKRYNGSGQLAALSVARVGSNYIITGCDYTNRSIFLTKTKLNGDHVWTYSYGDSGHNQNGYCVIGATDGGANCYLVVGFDIVSSTDSFVELLKVREDGSIIKKKTIYTEGESVTPWSVIASGSTYYIVGEAFNYSTSSNKAYVLQVNDNLDKIWDSTYGGDLSTVGKSIVKISDGLVIAGNTHHPQNPYLARISWGGDLVRQYVKNSTGEERISSLVLASDGDYIIAGDTHDAPVGEFDVYLAKIDSSVLDPLPTPTPSPSSAPTATATVSSSPTAAPTEEPGIGPTDEPGVEPTINPVTEPTSGPTAGEEASSTPVPISGETVTPAASPTSQAPAGDFSTSSVIIIILLTVIATALVGIGIWLFTQRKK